MSDTQNKVTIVAHDGYFHADEIFGVATLILVLGENNTEVIRSRENNVIEKGDYVLDVGGIYDADRNRFDHHQTGGAGKRDNGVEYASFGLVWKKFGLQLSGNEKTFQKIDKKLVQGIDLIDNGVNFLETKVEDIYPYTIGDFFSSLYPSWKEENPDLDSIFMKAVSFAKLCLTNEIKKANDKLESEALVLEAYNNAIDKRIIVLDKFYPASILKEFPEPLFVIFPKDKNHWRLRTIRDDENSFDNRKSFPKEWGGKKDEEFEKITGVEGALFCHPGLWMAGAKTKEAVLKLAQIALNS